MGNPYTLTFGKKPVEYIARREYVDTITDAFLEEPSRSQTFLIRGVRGSGKTVLMTMVSKEIEKHSDWVCVDLNSSLDLLEDFSYRLKDACESVLGILDRGVDISVAGFGVGVGGREDRDSVSRCEEFLAGLQKKKKKILITMDEVYSTKSMRSFVNQFQIWIRKDYPIFLLMTGLYENVDAIQNEPQLTFLLRSPKITMEPLAISRVAVQYEKTLSISRDEAIALANCTKGYAFAFQALGMIYYDYKDQLSLESVLMELDGYLDEYVYKKIWDGLSAHEKNIVLNIPDEKSIKVEDVRASIDMTSQVFSKYRERLINKGIITTHQHGYVELALPRFRKVCGYYV